MFKPYNKAQISFELKTEIGQEGANSKAYVALDHQLDADIVIKQIPKADFDSVDTYFEEAKTLYLSSHPYVVPVHYACQDDDCVYIAMPFYKRGSLNTLMETRFLTVREIVTLGCQIATGLHNIHSKGLVHFDVKPDNVLLSDRGEALISDFGLSRRLNRSGTAGQDRMYFKMQPPEAYRTQDFTCTFDIYQFGLTLYRMCNGNAEFYAQLEKFGTTQATFDRASFKHAKINNQFPDLSIYQEHIPTRLKRLIKKCLQADPSDRFHAAIEVANELAQIEDKLDWNFSINGSRREWVRQGDGREYRLIVESDGSCRAEKKMESGRTTRITSHCKASIDSKEIKTFLGET